MELNRYKEFLILDKKLNVYYIFRVSLLLSSTTFQKSRKFFFFFSQTRLIFPATIFSATFKIFLWFIRPLSPPARISRALRADDNWRREGFAEIFETKRSPSVDKPFSRFELFLRSPRRYSSLSRSNRTKRIAWIRACSTDRKERNRSKMAYNERYGFRSLETRLDDRFRHWDTRAWCARGENQWSGVRLICNSRFKDECRALGDETTACATVLLCRSNEQRYFVLGFFKKGFSPFKRCFLAAWKSANVQSSNTHTCHRYTYRYLSLVVYVHWE